MSLDKFELRRKMRHARKSLTSKQQIDAAHLLQKQVCSTRIFQKSSSLALYCAFDGEINPLPIAKYAWELGKKCYLPVIDRNKSGEFISFYLWNESDKLKINRFGVSEPDNLKASGPISPENISLFLIPMVAFDLHGNRLGMGGGFYDKLLAGCCANSLTNECGSNTATKRVPIRMGVAHDFQKVSRLPVNANDEPMHIVVTDQINYIL